MQSIGFPPIVGEKPRFLVLGSSPSVISLQEQQYYANARNVFWPIMLSIIGHNDESEYIQRIELLKRAKIAVWDVISSCERPGSLDSSIKEGSITVNNFAAFLKKYPTVESIYFNGVKAEQTFHRHVVTQQRLDVSNFNMLRLPSTSPANAGMSIDEKRRVWNAAFS